MDRNSLIGLVLIAGLLITWSYFFAPTPQDQQPMKSDSLKVETKVDTIQNQNTIVQQADTNILSSTFGLFTPVASGENQEVRVKTDLYDIVFTSRGALPVSVISTKYKTFDGKPLPLLENKPKNVFNYKIVHNNQVINTQELFFKPSTNALQVAGKDKQELLFTADLSEGKSLVFKYTFYGNSYHIDYDLITNGLGDVIKNNYIEFHLAQHLPKTEKSKEKMLPESSVYYLYNDAVDYLNSTSTEKETFQEQGKFKWVSFKSQFFSNAVIAKEDFESMKIESEILPDSAHVKKMTALLQIPYRHSPKETFSMKLFFGPNDLNLLKSYDIQLDRQINLGWSLFRTVTKFLIIPAFNIFETFTTNYGIVILLLAIFIKLLLSPLTFRSHLSMAKMRIVNSLPEMKAIEERYKDDATKLQQAKMQFYQQVGVSPLSGCLPMLLQIPILLSMFYFFPSSIQLRQEAFLWADDLSTYDSILDFGFSIPFYGDHVSLFTLLMTVSTIIYTYIQQKSQGDSGPKELKYMGYIFPIIFLGILNNYSAGLSWYYFVMNVLTIAQTYSMKYFVSEEKIKAKIEEAKKGPAKKSKLQKWMEDAQKQQNAKAKSPNKGKKK